MIERILVLVLIGTLALIGYLKYRGRNEPTDFHGE